MSRRPILRVVVCAMERVEVRKQGVVKTSYAIDGSDDRIVLLFWGLSDEPRLRNVARVDGNGFVQWRAELPGNTARDCFVSLTRRGDTFQAQTYAGHEAAFDIEGRPVEYEVAS